MTVRIVGTVSTVSKCRSQGKSFHAQSPEGLETKSKPLKRFTISSLRITELKLGVNERCTFSLRQIRSPLQSRPLPIHPKPIEIGIANVARQVLTQCEDADFGAHPFALTRGKRLADDLEYAAVRAVTESA